MYSISDIVGLLTSEPLKKTFETDADSVPRAIRSINILSGWFDASGTPFFRTYTDHSKQHCIDVFRTGVEFLSEEGLQVFSAKDLSIFLIASFCHDAGMHLTEKQFARLISPDNGTIFSALDEKSWPTIWKDFLDEAQRFNAKRLIDLFGDDKPVAMPPENPIDYTERDRLLIGDFLRSHHPRLAHDLALGLDQYLLLPSLSTELSKDDRDIVGLVSRSHGHPVRALFGYIKKHYDLRDYNRLHIVFLICLLRLADYAQLQATRAPYLKGKIHSIPSPISQREWRVHQSVRNITRSHDDPEAISVTVSPLTVVDFLRARDWLTDLQTELDKSWAVLGEIYGRQTNNGLNLLTLSLRRVRSSTEEIFSDLPFYPEKISFRVAEAEMLSLLLEPLYGNNPGYGVRELLQNAHDAVEEAVSIGASHLTSNTPIVKLEFNESEDGAQFIIQDNGIGMTFDVLKNYFLNAGASFRNSAIWQKRFTDDTGKSVVSRSGRFGVGALAAFIIGDTIFVQTRAYDAKPADGLAFKASLHDQYIQVERHRNIPIGTKITIPVMKHKVEQLKEFFIKINQFFKFSSRIYVQAILRVGDTDTETVLVSGEKCIRSLPSTNYDEVQIYPGNEYPSYEYIPDIVNGIAVMKIEDSHERNRIASFGHTFDAPFLLWNYRLERIDTDVSFRVVDKNAQAPVNLARNSFVKHDAEISSSAADAAFEELLEALPKLAKGRRVTGTFLRLQPPNFVYRGRSLLPLDVSVLSATSVRALVGLAHFEKPNFQLFASYPELGFVIGSGLSHATSRTEFVEFFRQCRSIDAEFESIHMLLDGAYIQDTLQLANVPNWYREMAENALATAQDKNSCVLSLGDKDSKALSTLARLKSDSGYSSIFYVRVQDWHSGSIWQRTKVDTPTPIAERWKKKFATSDQSYAF